MPNPSDFTFRATDLTAGPLSAFKTGAVVYEMSRGIFDYRKPLIKISDRNDTDAYGRASSFIFDPFGYTTSIMYEETEGEAFLGFKGVATIEASLSSMTQRTSTQEIRAFDLKYSSVYGLIFIIGVDAQAQPAQAVRPNGWDIVSIEKEHVIYDIARWSFSAALESGDTIPIYP